MEKSAAQSEPTIIQRCEMSPPPSEQEEEEKISSRGESEFGIQRETNATV